MGNRLTDTPGRGKTLSVENLKEFTANGKIPLRLLSNEVVSYIDTRIAALGGVGGDALANAVNYNGSVTTSGTANAVSQSVTSWKLRGFHIHGTGDADATLNYTVGGVAKTVKCSLDDFEKQFDITFPNPIAVDNGTVSVSVTNTSGASATYTGVLFGEAV